MAKLPRKKPRRQTRSNDDSHSSCLPKNQKMQITFPQRVYSSYWIGGQFASSRSFKSRSRREGAFFGKALLSKCFVKDDGGAVGQVERSGSRMEHRDAETAIWVLRKQLRRQAGGFSAENEKISIGVWNFGVVFGPGRFDEPKPSPSAVGCAKGSPVVPSMPRNLLPIVHSRTLQAFVVHLESERSHEVKGSLCRRAESGDIPGIGRNFGFNQDDVHRADYQGVGFLKANENFLRSSLGRSAQSLDRLGFFHRVQSFREGPIFRGCQAGRRRYIAFGAERNGRGRVLCRY